MTTDDALDAVRDAYRLAALRRLALLDAPAEEAFDRLTRLAARLLRAPVALVSLVDEGRQFFLSAVGLPEPWAARRQTPLSHSFCRHVVDSGAPLHVPDARAHPVLCHNLAVPELGVAAYLGVPLVTSGGHVLGSFCAIDTVPREWGPDDLAVLCDLAAATMTEVELRSEVAERRRAEEELRCARDELEDRIRARTAELAAANDGLRREVADRARAADALRASEERFRLLVEGVQDYAIFLLDPDGRVVSWNAGAERIKGYRADEIVGRHFSTFYTPADVARGHPAFELRHAAAHGRYAEEGERVRKDGSRFWAAVTLTALADPAGRHVGFAKVTRDVTERKQAEEALAERMRAAAAKAGVAAAVTAGGGFGPVLRACCERVVRELGTAFARVWTLDDAGEVLELRASAGLYTHTDGPHARVPVGRFKIGRIAAERAPHLTNDVAADPGISDPEWARREGMVAFAGYPLLAEGRLVGVLATFSRQPFGETAYDALAAVADIVAQFVERTRAEDALRVRERAIDAITQGVCITDPNRPDNPVVYVNRGFEATTGYAAAEAVGRNCRFLQGKDTDPAAVRAIREAVAAARPCAVELLNYTKAGVPFWNALVVAPVRDADGRLTHFVAALMDATPVRKLEEQFRQAQKMEAFGQLAGGVAHDFNNLLTVITGFTETALELLPGDAPARPMLDQVAAAGGRAADLTRQLLAFSRRSVLRPKVVDPNELVAGLERMLGRLIGEDVYLATALRPDAGRVRADPGLLEQVVVNLAVNARDAMPGGGRLTIATDPCELAADEVPPGGRPGRYVRVRVTDTGCGMTDEVKARLFEPFFTTKGVGKGTGLGLATVHGIVAQSGGHVTVDSAVGRGTTFTVLLPAAEPEAPGSRAGGPSRRPVGGTETVLVVEDDAQVRALAVSALRAGGYTVLEAHAGHAGPLHLLLTDVVMPEVGGRELAQRVTRAAPGARVLYMSGYTDDAVVRSGVSEAEVAFLQKPFGARDLLRKVREVLDQT